MPPFDFKPGLSVDEVNPSPVWLIGVDAVPDENALPMRPRAVAAGVAAGIAATTSATGPIDLGENRLDRIVMPAGWDAAAITFLVSANGVDYRSLFDAAGEVTIPAGVTGAGDREIVVPAATFRGIRYLRLRSGTAAVPVAQTLARALILATLPR